MGANKLMTMTAVRTVDGLPRKHSHVMDSQKMNIYNTGTVLKQQSSFAYSVTIELFGTQLV